MVGEEAVFALILDNRADDLAYLKILSEKANFRYLLTSHLDVFQELLVRELPASMFILRFTYNLTAQLKAYLDIISSPIYQTVPVLLLANPQTDAQARKIIERPMDSVLNLPCTSEELTARTALLLRRAVREPINLKIWIELDRRVIQGRATDISSRGLSGVIPDPILGNRVNVRIFAPGSSDGVLFAAEVKRKEKSVEGYLIGLHLLKLLEGDLLALENQIGLRFELSVSAS